MSGFTNSTTWTGRQLTAGDIRKLAMATGGMDDSETVYWHAEPSYPSPTDPGGALTIKITRTERQEK